MRSAVAAILYVLPACDDLRRRPWRGSVNPVAGHCYVVAEALRHVLGVAWRPMFVRHEGAPHWYLEHRETGEVLDLTAGQFEKPPAYSAGRGKGFLTTKLSRRAHELLRRAGLSPRTCR